jgi:catechol 2,3-dioxygenase-like lactoylglutathione lyase family enzyme
MRNIRRFAMTDPNFFILYVADPAASAHFYAGLLEHAPVEASPTFAMFRLASGTMLGLWSRHTVEPAPAASPGAAELAIAVAADAEVDRLHAAWSDRGIPIAQVPAAMDFGRTFVALDPDGHRVRVFAPH